MIIKISNTLFIDQSLVDSIYRSRGKTMIDLSNGSTFSSSKTVEEIAKAGIFGIHLGDYIFWDDERQTEFVKEHFGWRETEMEGTYKGYKSAECIMPGMHDFTCYLKRGYGRSTFHASIDVRNGLLTREEGFELAKKYDTQRPEALDYYLKVTGITEEEFYGIMKGKRLNKISDIDLPVNIKDHKNREVIKPYVEQLIERKRNQADPRDCED